MPTLMELLPKFNRKERFYVVGFALGEPGVRLDNRGEVRLRLRVPEVLGQQFVNLVSFDEDPLLGSLTLETFSLGVDPVDRRLIPVQSLEL